MEAFHFLRPAWLAALAPAILLYVVIERSSPERSWRRVIAPHLLRHLRVGGGRRAFRPIHLISLLMILASLALAGPTWEREPSPFTEDTAPLVIALDLSESMNAIDVAPSRLERGKHKIRDLLELRKGARTALVAYAGSAHLVVPLSDDVALLEGFLSALETGVMPVMGKDPSKALELAEELLSREDVPGSILFLTDGIGVEHVPAFVEHVEHGPETKDAVLVLAIGTSDGGPVRRGDGSFATDASGRRLMATLDEEGLTELGRRARVFVTRATVDADDVARLDRRIQTHLTAAGEEDETARWRDSGYYLTFPIAFLALLGFRKGWTVRWSAFALFLLSGCTAETWLTPDQQGTRFFERGAYQEAAAAFEDPMWKGIAYYRAGDFEAAIDAFARVDSSEADYNLGNTYAALERYDEAVASYEAALERRPGWVEASENLAFVRARLDEEAEEEDDSEAGGEPTFSADEVKFDEKGKKGKRGEVEMSLLTDQQIADMWLRRLSVSPADFLRRRFQMEAQAP